IDDQVKIRGFRIELAEIEHQLCQCDGVDSALVLARGEAGEDQQLVAYVLSEPGLQADRDEAAQIKALKRLLSQEIPEYMVPKHIIFVAQWPLTPNGKTDKKALALLSVQADLSICQAPVTPTEKVLVKICARLLKTAPENLSVSANFFELGGHSLLSVKLIAEIRQACGVELAVAQIFECSDISELADRIDSIARQSDIQHRFHDVTTRTDEQVEELVI
ncbi:MAG: hypothetical protein KKH70_20830, partial [Gammaproteobacteria bacterium]|nr:hypothetical protein [Gammaproteobacteria bacterium]MBU2395788.1 hypothetical protein [Gammaproteobacteria bacterium]